MKDIPEYEGRYAATKKGKIYSYRKKDYLKPYLNGKYYQIVLSKNKDRITHRVNILVAQAYIPNPDNLPIVNHIDGDTHNNRRSNLEWVSHARSIEHARETGLNKGYTRKVCQINDNGDVIRVFDSVKEASESVVGGSAISHACKGKRLKVKGYYWKYESDENWKMPVSKRFKRVQRTDAKTGEITIFETSNDAAASCGCSPPSIRNACNGVIDVLYGYRWKYLPREDPEPDPLFVESRAWKQVEGFPTYRISSNGRLYSDWAKQLRSLSDNNGYKRVELCHEGEKKRTSIHQLVAEHYHENPSDKKKVNHKNGEKGDNRLENLEWSTQSENAQHAYDTGLNKGSKPVVQYDLNGNFMVRYKSATEAGKKTDIPNCQISKVCQGTSVTAGKYLWRFEGDTLDKIPEKICHHRRKVVRIDDNGNEMIFNSLIAAAKASGGKDHSYIGKICRGVNGKAYGYEWKYAD